MAAIIPILRIRPRFNHGTFDSAAFAATALASPQALAAVIDHTLSAGRHPHSGRSPLRAGPAKYRFACAMINPSGATAVRGPCRNRRPPPEVVIGISRSAVARLTLRHEADSVTRRAQRASRHGLPIGQLRAAIIRPSTRHPRRGHRRPPQRRNP